MTTEYTTVDRIIAKLDNDFNPNNSDWIPRVGAWVYDALMQLDCMQTEIIKKKATVKNRIARVSCELNEHIKVYDENGCGLIELENNNTSCCGNNNKESYSKKVQDITPSTITKEVSNNEETIESIAFHINIPIPYPPRYNVVDFTRANSCKRGYVRIDNKTLELNFDTDFITIEYNAPKMINCTMYNCQSPMIPNNGKLIEAITYYCMYKMLTRGYIHPVMNLAASQYGTNPYYIWMQIKDEAKRSVINDGINNNLDDLWRSAFYINTFNPRGKR